MRQWPENFVLIWGWGPNPSNPEDSRALQYIKAADLGDGLSKAIRLLDAVSADCVMAFGDSFFIRKNKDAGDDNPSPRTGGCGHDL